MTEKTLQRHADQFPPPRAAKISQNRGGGNIQLFFWHVQVLPMNGEQNFAKPPLFLAMSIIDVDAPTIGVRNTHSMGLNFTTTYGLLWSPMVYWH